MAVAFDFGTGTNTSAINAASKTFSHTCSGSNLILIVGVAWTSASVTVSSVSYNGVALTAVAAVSANGNIKVQYYYLVAPATGANNVIVTMSANASFVTASASFTGASQGVPGFIDTPITGSTAIPSGSSTPGVANGAIVSLFGQAVNASTSMTSGTLVFGGSNSSGSFRGGMGYTIYTTPSAITHTYSNSSGSPAYVLRFIAIYPPGAVTNTSNFFTMF